MSNKPEWWIEFFAGPWGEVQALGYPEEQTRNEVDFLVEALALKKGARVLDIGCGVGRHCIELAKRGYECTGIDFNESAIVASSEAAADAGVRPSFVELDMKELEAQESYDGAYCFFTSFGYFSDKENKEVASRFANALKPGGRVLIDTLVTESLFPVFQQFRWRWADESRTVRVLQESKWDPVGGRVNTEWSFVRESGPVETARSSLRVYSYKELHALLLDAGFSNVQGVETGTDEPFQLGSRRLSVIGQKAGG